MRKSRFNEQQIIGILKGGVSLTRTSLQNARKPRLSGRKLAPLGQGSRTALLENVAALEVAVRVEVIEQGGVNRGKLLQGLDILEPRHRSLPSSKGLMQILGPIVEPSSTYLASLNTDILHRCAVGAQPIGHDGSWPAVALHRALQERPSRSRRFVANTSSTSPS
jgi:hypothetical protein